jgi:hypothetical protein
MQETSDIASLKTAASPKWFGKLAWFLRICGVLALLVAIPRITHEGWPHSLRGSGGLAGLFNGTMLLVMSFLYVTTGRTKMFVACATIVLGVWVMVFSAAMLVLPHL